MTRDDIIRMAEQCGIPEFENNESQADNILRFAALVAAAEREKVARWMMERGYATGHGDSTEDLLQELDWQIAENWNRALINGITTERDTALLRQALEALKQVKPLYTKHDIIAALCERLEGKA
jgi:glycosyltransferase A (GT-A) superfamily protein (DUF2064 family)